MNVFLKYIIKQFSAWKSRHVGKLETQACWKQLHSDSLTNGWMERRVLTGRFIHLFNAHNIIFYFEHLSKIIQILIILVFNIFDLLLQSVLRIESNDLKDETSLR